MKEAEKNKNIQKLSRAELTKTQVLNLKDLENVVKYEKRTSKKPAVILAILGSFFILSGFSYMGIANIINNSPSIEKTNVYRKEITQEEDQEKTITCNYSQQGNIDGTDMIVDMTLHLTDKGLTHYEKSMLVTPTLGNEATGLATIQTLLPAYQAFEPLIIPGYNIKSLPENIGFKTDVAIDLTSLDQTLLTYHHANVVTKVEFALADTEDMIMAKAASLGYVCQIK